MKINNSISGKIMLYAKAFYFRWFKPGKRSYSQEGEDLILNRIMGHRDKGFYVDIGSFHPVHYSNTYFFYLMGWNGINLDATPGIKPLFDLVRPGDINLESAVSGDPHPRTFYMFRERALNTFSKEIADEYISLGHKLINTLSIKALPLAGILQSYVPAGQAIDFMSIDVEGAELSVLNSNDWDKYRPRYILIEALNLKFEDINSNQVHMYLKEKGYELRAKSMNTLIYGML